MKLSIPILVALGTSLGACSEPERTMVSERSHALIEQDLRSELSANEVVPIIVNLRLADDASTDAIASAQEALLKRNIVGFSLGRRYHHVPALSGRATAQAVQELASDPGVSLVQRDHPGGGQLKEAVPAIGGDKAREMFGVTGRGVRVAVLDTGIDTDHPDLRDALVAQHCFTQSACPPFGSEGTSAEDDHGHGTNVAGIIASDGVVSARGFAPAAELVALKINDANDSGQESDWIAGMDWLLDNLATQKVRLANLSIGTTAVYMGGEAECDRAHPAMAAVIKKLVGAGITVFAATGNRGITNGMSAPACNSNVIAVGAVYDSNAGRQPPTAVGATYRARWGAAFAACSDATSDFDQIACFTNSSPRMDLVAPGATIISDSLRGRTEAYWGTSQAAPAAVGVAALLLECNPSLTPAQIKDALIRTGNPVKDARNGLSFPSLRALAAVRSVCDEGAPGLPTRDASTELPGDVADAGNTGATGTLRDAAAGLVDAGSFTSSPDASSVRDAGTNTVSWDASLPIANAAAPDTSVASNPALGSFDASIIASAPRASADCDCALAASYAQRGSPRHALFSLLGLLACTLRLRSGRRRARAGAVLGGA